jgi:hypothetical protein
MGCKILQLVGFRRTHLQLASLASVFLCISMWIRAKTVNQSERGHAENRALFVGLWPPTLWLLSDCLGEQEPTNSH